jgi:hypothetical protein
MIIIFSLTCNIKDIAYSNRADGNDEAEVDANQRKGKVCIRCVFLYGNIIIKRKKKNVVIQCDTVVP